MQLWEARVPGYSFHNNSDLQHQHDQCKCWSIAKGDIFQVDIKHSYSLFGCKYSLKLIPYWSLFQISKFTKFYQSTIINKILIVHNISKFYKKVNKTCVCWDRILSNEILKPTNNKLLNQTSCKYVRRAICLVLIINSKCQWGCWPCNLFAHRLHCTLASIRLIVYEISYYY